MAKDKICIADKEVRESLIDWRQESITSNQASKALRWHRGQVCNRLPNKSQINKLQMDAIGHGWLPEKPFITPNTRVVALGSCFASYFILWLADNGFNKETPKSPYNALLRFGSEFENAAVIAQQFRWAFGELDGVSLLWIDKNKQLFEATKEKQQLVKETILNTDVLIITLGLSEIWYDQETNEPMWRTITSDQYDSKKHVFKVETMSHTLDCLNTIERLREKYAPNLKIIFTLSPVRLSATFRPISTITANSASKGILRAALDEFLRNQQTKLNQTLFYFPSYELATEYFINPYEHDNRHITSTTANNIIQYFVKYYCCISDIQNTHVNSKSMTPTDELLDRINALENRIAALQKTCDERMVVIENLDKAAKERLILIHELDKKLKQRS